MKAKFLRVTVFLLTIALLVGLVPMVSLAADNELVLTKIGHNSTDIVSLGDPTVRAVTLTVPFLYAGSAIDLKDGGLRIEKAPAIGPVVTDFSSGSTATIGNPGSPGPAVVMTVKYYKGTDTTTQYTTLYSVSIVRAAKKDPTFTGTISKSFTGVLPNTAVNDIIFTTNDPLPSNDFSKLYTANDGGQITDISVSGTSLACGVLKIAGSGTYTNYIPGDKITIANIGNLVFDALDGGSVSYLVSAYAGNNTPIGSVLLNIDVKDITAPTLNAAHTMTKSISTNANATFSVSDFTSLCSLNYGTFNSIEITPTNTGFGTWYNGSSPFTTATLFNASTIGNLKFIGGAAGTANFAWRVSNEAGFSAPGNGTIAVRAVNVPTITAAVTKAVAANATLTFSLSDFSGSYNLNNGTLNSIVITPTNYAYGTWYKGSYPFTSATAFNASEIGSLQFKGTQAGQALFNWTVSNEQGASSAGSGSITVTTAANAINYTTAQNTAKTFAAADFSTACYNATSGSLLYVAFTSIAPSAGTLYYGYTSASSPGTAITSNNQFAPAYLSAITFVPTTNYNGTVTITYTGVNTAGVSYTGYVKIAVGTSAGNSADVTYTTAVNTPKTFTADDFNAACNYATGGGTLAFVVFTATNPAGGALYYGYSSASNPGTAINSSHQIAPAYLSAITFVPTSSYTGLVTITYTGVTTAGTSYTGYVKIGVGVSSGSSADVTYTTAVNTPKTFAAADFNAACSYATGGGTLASVVFTAINPAGGTLYYGYTSASSPGTAINSSNQIAPVYLSGITFVPVSNYSGLVTITYTGVTTAGTTYTGYVKIGVGVSTSSSADVTYTTAVNTPKTFAAADFSTACSNATGGGTLASVVFTAINPAGGTLYYGYTSASNPGTAINSSNQIAPVYLSGITFVPVSNYSGLVTITYTGVTTAGTTYTGYVKIGVGVSTSSSADVTYTTAVNTSKTFAAADFSTACSNATGGGTLSYVVFTATTPAGSALYYGYTSASNPGTAINSSSQIPAAYLSGVTFVPALNYTGSVTITYTGVTTTGASYTGYVKIAVGVSAGSSSDVTYTTAVNTPKTLASSDFTAACSYATSGGTLSYIYFPSLSATGGALYYGYTSALSLGTAISANTQIATSYLSSISFVPVSNYAGTYTVAYTGVTTAGTTYTGYLKITVGGSLNVSYTTNKNTAKAFSVADFNTACYNATGLSLSRIILAPPAAAFGTLYTNYSSSSSPGTAVTASTVFNASSTPSISSVTFVPASNFTGTVTLPYTGYNTSGVLFQGSVVIKVNGPAGDISYTLKNNQTVKFVAADINTVCYNATGANLNYVTFTLPAAVNGKLYYNYTSAASPGTAVAAGTAYYASNSPTIANVTFVPAAAYKGSVTINYTGYNVNGIAYTGKIVIQVNSSTGSSHFTDVGLSYDWAVAAIDYLYDAGIVKGTSGTLYSPSINMSRGDFLLMLYRAMGLSGSTSSNFSDVPKGSYYYDAIAVAKALGIAQGTNNKISPLSPITRQDAMVFTYRALLKTGKTLTAGSSADISGFTDKGTISSYALTAVQTLVKAGIIKGNGTKLSPAGNLSRAEMAVVMYRVKITY